MSLLDLLGSKSRLKLLRALTDEPKYVSELAEEVGLDGKSTVHHLAVLEESGLVEHYRTSNRKYYRLVKTVTLEATPPPERTFILQVQDADAGDEATHTPERL